MQDAEYQEYLKNQSYEDLLAIRSSLDKAAHPERFSLLITEIEGRDKLTIPSPFPGSEPDTTWRSSSMPIEVGPLTKLLLIVGFLFQIANLFMRHAEAQAVLASRPIVALAGVFLFAAGCVRLARSMGRSGWYGLLGLLGIIGLAILAALPKKTRISPLQNGT